MLGEGFIGSGWTRCLFLKVTSRNGYVVTLKWEGKVLRYRR